MSTVQETVELGAEAPEGKKAARREAMRQGKQEEHLRRRLDSWERYRALWDGIDLKRQLVGVSDKKARFALVIMGALNAAVYVVLVRGSVVSQMPAGLRSGHIPVRDPDDHGVAADSGVAHASRGRATGACGSGVHAVRVAFPG